MNWLELNKSHLSLSLFPKEDITSRLPHLVGALAAQIAAGSPAAASKLNTSFCSLSATMRSRVVVDPDGDVLLQPCQDQEPSPSDRPDNIEILVSWKPLSLASSVFRDGPFKQGIEHHKKSSPNEPYEMPMKWDDGDALILLARIVHFKLADISDTPTAVELEKLMYLCDKYDCIDILKCFGILWIRALLRKYDDMEDQPIDDLCRLLVFAYVVDLWTEFTAIAWKIFLFHKGPFEPPGKDNSKINVLGNHRLVRHDLARKIALMF